MHDFMDEFFGPLPREYCVYFYALSIIFGLTFIISLLSILTFVITKYKKVNATFVANSIMILINIFFVYLSNRLLHTMCVKSI